MANSDELDFSDLKEQAGQLLEIYNEQLSVLQKQAAAKHQLLSSSPMPDTIEGIKKETAAKKEAIVVDGKLTQAKKDQIATQQILNQLTATERIALKDSAVLGKAAADSYAAQSIELRKLNEQYKLADKATREKLSPEILKLNNNLKSMDATLGIHNRNVGNYTNSIKGLAVKMSGLTGLMGIFGRIVGVDTEVVMSLYEAHSVLRESSRDLTHLTHEHTAAIVEDSVATEGAAVANEEMAATATAALGPIGWVIAGIAALVIGISALIEVNKEHKEREDAMNTAMDGTILSSKKLREEYDKEQNKLAELGDEYKVLIGTMSKYQAKQNSIMRDLNLKQADLSKETADKITDIQGGLFKKSMEFLTKYSGAYFFEKMYEQHLAKETTQVQIDATREWVMNQEQANAELLNNMAEAHKEALKELEEELKKQADASRDLQELKLSDAEKINELRLKVHKTGEELDIAEVENTQYYELKKLDIKAQAIKEEYKEDARMAQIEGAKIAEEKETLEEESGLKIDEIREKYAQKEIERENKLLEAFKKHIENIKKEAEKALGEFEKGESITDASQVENDKLKTRQDQSAYELGLFGDPDSKLAKKLNAMQQEADKTQEIKDKEAEDRHKVENDKTLDPNERKIKLHDIAATADQDILELHLKTAKELKKIDEDVIKNKEKKEKESAKKGLTALKKILDDQNKIRQQSLKEQMDNLQQQVDQNSQLHAAGRRNGLAQSLAAENSIAVQQMNLQTQSEGINSAMSLANILLNLQKTGGFYEGTPDTGGPGQLDNRGGMLAMLHPNEAVIPKARNEEYPGLAKAWISGNLDTYLAKLSMPEIQSVDMKEVKEELTDIKNVLLKQPWAVAYTHDGKAIIEEHTGDSKKTRVIEESLTIRTN